VNAKPMSTGLRKAEMLDYVTWGRDLSLASTLGEK
jgi:hypothetical protein